MRLLLVALLAVALAQDKKSQGKPPAKKTNEKTRAEVDALIKKIGPTPPDWFAKVTPNPPKTLDLSWPEPPPTKGWDQNKNMGQYIWSTINENPSKWQEGVKLMHQLLTMHKDDKEKLHRVIVALGRMYHNLLEDYPRAAYWWRKALEMKEDDDNLKLELADCYWKLGCKEMAVELIDKFGQEFTRHGALIKLWGDMGELDKALKLAEDFATGGYPDVGYLGAGDACRTAGKFDDAIKYYQKAIDAPDGGRDIPKNKGRAKASLEAIKLFDKLDLKKVPPGKYKSSSIGYEAQVEIEVTVAGGKITDLKVTKHNEKQFYSSMNDTPRRIIEKQSVKGIDTTTNATLTSEAIINATAKALSGAMKK